MSNLKFQSLFDPSIQIDSANAIVERLIRNYCQFKKMQLPTSPFWRKDIKDKSDSLNELAKRYGREIIGAKRLLQKFDVIPIFRYFDKNKYMFAYMCYKEFNRKKVENGIAFEQRLYEKEQAKLDSQVNDLPIVAPVVFTKTLHLDNKLSQL